MATRTQRHTPARLVEDAFQRVYDRFGTRELLVIGLASLSLAVLVVAAAVALVNAGYDDRPYRDLLPYAGLAVLFTLAGLLMGLALSWRQIRVVLGWSGASVAASPTPEAALEVWSAALVAPRVLTVRATITTCTAALAYQMLVYRDFDLPWSVFPVNALGIVLISAGGGVAAMLYLEYVLRPVTTDIARWLPPNFTPEPPRLALYTKAILPIPGIVFYTGLFVGGFVDGNDGYAGELVGAVTVSIVVSVVAVALYYILAHAFLNPIESLTAATRRVHDGDLDTRVTVTSGDELGGLAISFNQMLDGLQEREQLRSHNVELSGRLEETLEEVRASRARIVAAADEERRRMERDLHDGAQQRLVMISLKLGMAADLVGKDPAAAAALHEELRNDSSRALEELRDLAHGIYPPLLESDGLAPALEDVADQFALPVEVDSNGTGRYPPAVEAAVYFCCLEALQNAAKHAGSGIRATIELSDDAGDLFFAVTDDGRGFDSTQLSHSTGLQNMTDRIGALGGTVSVTSMPGTGTRVEGRVPASVLSGVGEGTA